MEKNNSFYVRPVEWVILAFTLTYIVGFSSWFLIGGNYEFIIYVITMIVFIVLVGMSVRVAEYPSLMLWGLALWGLAHMLGGGVPVGDSVLYSYQLIDLYGSGEFTILKYDQMVHAFGFGVAAWLLWHLLVRHHPETRHTWTAYVYPILGSMGLGALNEVIEFSAVLMVPETNVGGYYNTALDLVFNAGGAVFTMLVVAMFERGRKSQH